MPQASISTLLYFYGAFLIICGIISVIFIGIKAKTALISGGFAGTMAIFVAYLVSTETQYASSTGMFLSFALFCVFSWRSTKTLFTIFKMIPEKSPELNRKGIAFLIISLMAVVSIVITILQVMFFQIN